MQNPLVKNRCRLCWCWLGAFVLICAQSTFSQPLTNAAQVRRLSVAKAAEHLPVELSGIVVSDSAGGGSLVVLVGEESIYCSGSANALARFRFGDVVEISGATDPGGFAPIVNIRSIKKTGVATLPNPARVTLDDLVRKPFDAQFVEVSGIVRSCEPAANTNDIRSKMIIHSGGRQLAVRFHTRQPSGALVDAEVRLRGICFNRYTVNRQSLSPMLDVPNSLEIIVENPPPKNPWASAPVAVADLMKFSPGQDYGHRVRLKGVVTSQAADGTLWLRDGDYGIQVRLATAQSLAPGDVVEVLGFPVHGNYVPAIEDAELKKISHAQPPAPRMVTNLISAVHQDSDLIELEAKLNGRRPVRDGWALTLDWQKTIIEARLYWTNNTMLPADWLPGAIVRVSGICSAAPEPTVGVALTGVWEPDSFTLLMRSPADLVVTQPAPWWTPAHVSLALGAVLGGLLLATGLLTFLARRRINEQKRQRAMAEREFTAILSERNRVAREIHDTLAQGLVATSVQLRLAKKQAVDGSEALHHSIDSAQQLVRSSLDEARNSIWNMRSQVLENGDLASALEGILQQMAEGSEMKTSFVVLGNARRLVPAVESNALRVGQEAITNAAKHAQAKNLAVKLQFGAKHFQLVVTDDGCGFNPASPPPSDGGFGLVGMRERAKELKGELTIRSTPGQGTEITFHLPLAAD